MITPRHTAPDGRALAAFPATGQAVAAAAGKDPGAHGCLPGPRFRILGPLEVCPVPAARLRNLEPLQRRLLAVLALQPGLCWPGPLLTRALHGESAVFASDAIRSTVYRLRRALDEDHSCIGCTPQGYVLHAAAGDTDAGQLAILAARGRVAWYDGDVQGAAALLGHAVRLWREPALADLPRTPALAGRRARLIREYRDARDLRIDAGLRLGGGPELIPVLRQITAAAPLHEHGWVQLMSALAQNGDLPGAARALTAARAAIRHRRRREPGPELSALAGILSARGRMPEDAGVGGEQPAHRGR